MSNTATCESGLPIPVCTFCSELLGFARAIACAVRVSLLEAIAWLASASNLWNSLRSTSTRVFVQRLDEDTPPPKKKKKSNQLFFFERTNILRTCFVQYVHEIKSLAEWFYFKMHHDSFFFSFFLINRIRKLVSWVTISEIKLKIPSRTKYCHIHDKYKVPSRTTRQVQSTAKDKVPSSTGQNTVKDNTSSTKYRQGKVPPRTKYRQGQSTVKAKCHQEQSTVKDKVPSSTGQSTVKDKVSPRTKYRQGQNTVKYRTKYRQGQSTVKYSSWPDSDSVPIQQFQAHPTHYHFTFPVLKNSI